MKTITNHFVKLVLMLLAGFISAFALQSNEFTAQQERGKEIYFRGTSSFGKESKEIKAVMGADGVETTASVLSCANCHGYNGRGKPEGGVVPSDITWLTLTKPYEITLAGGRKRKAYTERLLKRAITMGIDSAGNQLHVAMPRYRLSVQDAEDLVAFLKKLGDTADLGLGDDSLCIGVMLPPPGQLVEMSKAVESVLSAYFEEINQQGGIHNRRIALRFIQPSGSPEDRAAALGAALRNEQVFALTAAFLAGADEALGSAIRREGVPVVGAFTLYPKIDLPLNRFVFYLYAGIQQQSITLANFARTTLSANQYAAAVLTTRNPDARHSAEAIRKYCESSGWRKASIAVIGSPAELSTALARLKETDTRVIFISAPGLTAPLLSEAAARNWNPLVLLPGSLADAGTFDTPLIFDRKIFVAFPTLPADQTVGGLAEHRRLAQTNGIPSRHLASQLNALASAKILAEALKRAGRDVSREKLIEVLEGLYEFETGLGAPVTYSPNRRIGAEGGYVVSVDLKAKRLEPLKRVE